MANSINSYAGPAAVNNLQINRSSRASKNDTPWLDKRTDGNRLAIPSFSTSNNNKTLLISSSSNNHPNKRHNNTNINNTSDDNDISLNNYLHLHSSSSSSYDRYQCSRGGAINNLEESPQAGVVDVSFTTMLNMGGGSNNFLARRLEGYLVLADLSSLCLTNTECSHTFGKVGGGILTVAKYTFLRKQEEGGNIQLLLESLQMLPMSSNSASRLMSTLTSPQHFENDVTDQNITIVDDGDNSVSSDQAVVQGYYRNMVVEYNHIQMSRVSAPFRGAIINIDMVLSRQPVARPAVALQRICGGNVSLCHTHINCVPPVVFRLYLKVLHDFI